MRNKQNKEVGRENTQKPKNGPSRAFISVYQVRNIKCFDNFKFNIILGLKKPFGWNANVHNQNRL